MIKATASTGQSATQTLLVTSTGPAPVQVAASPAQGMVPLGVIFTVNNRSGNAIRSIQADFTGSGIYTTVSANAVISNSYPLPGTYQAGFIITDSAGTTYPQTVTIVAQDAAQIDRTLRAAWGGFTSALASRDTAQALQYFNAQARAKYGPLISALQPYLPQIVANFAPLQLSSLEGGIGEYAVNRVIDGVNRIFFIYFLQDEDGVWRLDSM